MTYCLHLLTYSYSACYYISYIDIQHELLRSIYYLYKDIFLEHAFTFLGPGMRMHI